VKTCIARLKSVSAYSQSAPLIMEKLDDGKETAADFEKRNWRERCHADENDMLFIPGMSFKMALDRAATFLGIKIAGKRNATYTKHFLAGVLVLENVPLGIHKKDAEPEWLFMNSDGVRGSGKRVWRCYPLIQQWEADVTFYIADDTITKEVFEKHLHEAGKFIGVGRFRPEKGGFKGRFQVLNTSWS
jgi:hypothetical protein